MFPVSETNVSHAAYQHMTVSAAVTYPTNQFARLHLTFSWRVGNFVFKSLTIITLTHIRVGANESPMEAIVTPEVPLTGRVGPLSAMYQTILPIIAPRTEADAKKREAFLLSIPPRIIVARKKAHTDPARYTVFIQPS